MIDHSSSAAQSYQELFKQMLEKERKKNDGLSLTDADTQQIRGRISVLKELIALPEAKNLRDAQSVSGYLE